MIPVWANSFTMINLEQKLSFVNYLLKHIPNPRKTFPLFFSSLNWSWVFNLAKLLHLTALRTSYKKASATASYWVILLIETCIEQRRPKLQDVIHVFTIALIFLMYLLAFLFLNLLFYIYCNETALVKKAIMYVCVYYVCDWFKVIHHNHMEN